ncbi:FkbM family methyltransferase [Aequorivita viscosa]|uniref:FkbM family methyltransferase n=1 Tax=Aequorivita viscosa TaxID=797419 RepID=UPI00115FE0B2|nr:FkbM family methyltransferase [Aequorivita viscosa]
MRNTMYPFHKLLKPSIQIPPSGIISLKTDSGHIKIATNQTSYLTKLLFWEGYKSFEYSEIFETLSKKADCFFDIGANIGYYSLLASKANPSLKIFAFEPATGPKYYLKKNISLNNLNNSIIPVEYALSKESHDIDFYEVKSSKYDYLDKNLSGEHNTGTKTKTRNFVKTTVKAISLVNFIKDKNIQKIDLIKIDTEGTEVEILESGKEYIERFKPIVICETLFNTTENLLTDFFTRIGYDFYNHSKNGLKKVDTLYRLQDDGIRNCFFVPKEKSHLIAEFLSEN